MLKRIFEKIVRHRYVDNIYYSNYKLGIRDYVRKNNAEFGILIDNAGDAKYDMRHTMIGCPHYLVEIMYTDIKAFKKNASYSSVYPIVTMLNQNKLRNYIFKGYNFHGFPCTCHIAYGSIDNQPLYLALDFPGIISDNCNKTGLDKRLQRIFEILYNGNTRNIKKASELCVEQSSCKISFTDTKVFIDHTFKLRIKFFPDFIFSANHYPNKSILSL